MAEPSNEPAPRKKRWHRTRRGAAVVGALSLLAVGALVMSAWSAMGTAPSGERRARMARSANFDDGIFINALPMEQMPLSTITYEWLRGGSEHRQPAEPPPVAPDTATALADAPADGLRVTWMGHSTVLVEVDGQRFLTDPVFSERTSPWTSIGPSRFHPTPLSLDELPPLDAVVISHDHYDHLDAATIATLASRVPRFIVPLGVGAHLEYWGVPADKIDEHDWWDETDIGGVRLVCTPARHFSGRGLGDKDRTLWASWSFVGPDHRVFFSGDTGMHPGFSEIGDRLGPFDLTMIEVGAYSRLWADVHLGPEQAVRAHRMLRGNVMLPVHWGTFDLGLHGWTEPIERLVVEAERTGTTLVSPIAGSPFAPAAPPPLVRWWPEIPWQTAEEHRVVSSNLPETLLTRLLNGPRPAAP